MFPILFSLATLSALANALLTTDDSSKCSCYRTTSSESTQIFANHVSQDFRNLKTYINDGRVRPAPTTPLGASTHESTNDYFESDEWTSLWSIQSWNNSYPNVSGGDPTLLMVNSRGNVYLERDNDADLDKDGYNTHLSLRTARAQKFQSSAEIESIERNFQFLSMRMLARTVGADGACTAMFTYLSDTQEADIEFLTGGPRDVVQYTNQPGGSTGTVNATLPVAMGEWAEHRLDWTDGRSEWFVNGEHLATLEKYAPTDPAMVILNSWSNGGSWTGVMAVNASAVLQIQWLEIAYNVTGDAESNIKCDAMCDLDKSDTSDGNDDNDSAAIGRISSMGWAFWILAAQLVAAVVFGV